MLVLRPETRRSIRRSRNREAVLQAYRERGRLGPRDVALATGLPEHRVLAALHGALPDYAPARSLVGLRLVRAVPTAFGVEHELTEAGVEEAGALAVLRAMRRPV